MTLNMGKSVAFAATAWLETAVSTKRSALVPKSTYKPESMRLAVFLRQGASKDDNVTVWSFARL